MDQIFSIFAPYITLILLTTSKGTLGATFTIINKCDYIVWPGILANAGTPPVDSTGFELPPGGSRSFQVPPNWSGRLWGRTGCTFNPSTNQATCLTGDCGSNQIECNGNNAIPPATLAEFFIGSGASDFYDVSLVDGYNLPMIVEPNHGSGTCLSTGCVTNLNQQCPTELQAESGQACKSACLAYGTPEYCCSGTFGSPDTCKPSAYSEMFKTACPRSYSYAYDDLTSTFTCTGADYVITFCPSLASQKSARDPSPTTSTTNGSDSTGSLGDGSSSSSSSSSPVVAGIDPSWSPIFLTGDSSHAGSWSSWHFTLILISIISFLYFS